MQRGNTVYGIACSDRQMGHFYLSVIDDRHLADLLLVARIFCFDLFHKAAVDLLDDLIDTRKQAAEQLDRPFLQCLCHDRMIGVSTGLCGYFPCLVPAKTFLIHEDTHKLCNRYGRMGIVQLEGCLLIELTDIAVVLFILCNSFLYTCGNEEILLFQTKLFTCVMLICRIEDLNDVLCQVFLLNGIHVITLVEGIQLEIHDGLCIPYAKRIYHTVVVTNDGDIKGNGTNGLIVLLDEVVAVIFLIVFHTHITAEFYFFGILRTAKLEGVAVFQPVIRYLYLITVLDLLFKHSVTITDTTAVSRIIQGCQRIQEAGCQTAQSTVSKSSIRLLILDDVQVKTKLIQSFFYLIVLGQVDQVVSHGTTHQELHGHVINVFRILFLIFFLGHHPIIDDAVLYRIRHGLEDLLFVSFLDIFAVKLLYIIFYFCNKSFFVEFLHDCLLFYLL